MVKRRVVFWVAVMTLLKNFTGFGGEVDYRYEMKKLIDNIGDKTPERYIVIQQNAVDLYFEGKTFKREWLEGIEGISQESIYYGDPTYNAKTPGRYKTFLETKLKKVAEEGVSVFTTNYAGSFWSKWVSDREAQRNGFVNYNVPDREVSLINDKIPHVNSDDIEKLEDVRNLLYLLNPEKYRSKREYIDTIAKTNFDLIIIDAFFKGKALNKKDIEKMRYKKNGGKRLIVSYFSIGEAEDYRYYWKNKWDKNPPEWLGEENPNWEGNYIVKYWHREWHGIIEEYLSRIVETGFDGVFLDTVDTYNYYMEWE